MRFHKLITQLQAFDKVQLKRLAESVHSPYFKLHKATIALFDYLENLHPRFTEKKIEFECIAQKTKELSTESMQAKAATLLLQHIDRFLVIEHLITNPKQNAFILLQAQKDIGLSEAYGYTLETIKKELTTDKEKGIDYFYDQHILTESEFNSFGSRLNRTQKNDIKPLLKTLDSFYALKKLRYQCEFLNRHQVLGTQYDVENTLSLLEILKPFNKEDFPYVHLFVNAYKMLSANTFNEGEEYYQNLHEFIQKIDSLYLPKGVKEVIDYIINYSLFWNNKGYQQAGWHAMVYFEAKLKFGLLLEKQMIQPSDYRAIVSLAILTQKDPIWIKQFINNYCKLLPPEHFETNYAFTQAQYFYYSKDFKAAMGLFQKAQVKDEPIFNAIVRRWQFMCMYEQSSANKTMLIDYLISWERYQSRNKNSMHQYKETFDKIISYSKKLVTTTQQKDREKVIIELEHELFFAGKDWLIQQLRPKSTIQVNLKLAG